MTEIFNKGNLPSHLQVMAKEVEGQRSTKFFEFKTAELLLKHASEGNCEETTVTIDRKTNRGYIVAFSFDDSAIEDIQGNKLVVMSVYFSELETKDIQYYSKMLHEHRNQQEDAHTQWKNKQGATNAK